MKTSDRARGKWRGILLGLGVESKLLDGKHGPCPFCEGRDRFRWDNSNGNGSFICGQCGAGDGIEFLKRLKGWDFKEAARAVDEVIGGGVTAEKLPPRMDEKTRIERLNKLWADSIRLDGSDMASRYLAGRDVLPASLPSCLRFAARCPVPGGNHAPALIALVSGSDGNHVNMHRTFLGPNGKADMDNPRAMMPGEIPAGSAVRLFPVHGNRLGIAEGIETAFAAAKRFGMPVWSAINSNGLSKWQPPAGVDEVHIFGDCDPKFGGQAAAFALAHRLAARLNLAVQVHIPGQIGLDWADSDAA